jgi:5'-3' exonuclease
MIVIIDTNHSFHKSYFVVKSTQSDFDLSKVKYKGMLVRKAVTDLMASIDKLYMKPSEVFFCFDDHSWRKSESAEYKADRSKKEPEFYECIQEVHDSLKRNGYKVVKSENAESDDCISVLCSIFHTREKLIISADEDMHQLIDQHTYVWNNNLKKPIVFISENNEKILLERIKYEKRVVDPKLVLFKKIMLGCSGDNISPLIDKKGVGEKTVEKVYKTLIKKGVDPINDIMEIRNQSSIMLKYNRHDFINKANQNRMLVELSYNSMPKNIWSLIFQKIVSTTNFDSVLYGEVLPCTLSHALNNSRFFEKK